MMVFDRVVAVADRLTWQSWAATLCFAVFTQVLSHPNHTSLAEIEFNTKTGRFEVSLCVWPEDLEKALEKMVEETLKLNEDNVKEHVPKYLRNNFKLVGADSSAWTIRWVGAEIDVKKTWLYFEMVPASKADVFKQADVFKLENRLFVEFNDDQVNHVKIKRERDADWFRLTKTNPICDWELKQ